MRVRLLCSLLLFFVATFLQVPGRAQSPAQSQATGSAGLLSQERLNDVFPASVFFAGKQATTQVRNGGGVQSNGDKVTAFALVDASGYSSGIRERYQFYLLTSVAVEVAGKRLEPGAYGGGFVNGKALLLDLSAKELSSTAVTMDAQMKRPRPLQVVAGEKPGEYRLYLGREYVLFRQIL